MCQIHKTVFKKQLLGICIPVPPVPRVLRIPRKWCHEVLLGPPFPRDHIQFFWILVSKNLSFVNTSRTKWPRIQKNQNLKMFWILVSKIAAGVLIFVCFLQQQLQNKRIQTYPKHKKTYPKQHKHVSKTHCACIQKSYPKKDKRIQKRTKSYQNVSNILDTKRIQN